MRRAGSLGRRARRGASCARAMLLAAAALALAACDGGGPTTAGAAPARPNVLLVCVDTLRADALGFLGAARETSPHLDRLAREGFVFRRAFAAYPATKASVASLFTSLYPTAHQAAERRALSPLAPTLAAGFAAAGYATAAIVTNPHLAPGMGFERGFERYVYLFGRDARSQPRDLRGQRELPGPSTSAGARVEYREAEGDSFYARGDAVNAAALAWLDARDAARPFFLYLHYMDVHNPYVSPEPWHAMFVEQPGRDVYVNGIPTPAPTAADVAYMRALYDGQVRWVDHLVGQLLAELAARGVLDETVLVLVSDHGDEFLEHGGLGHGLSLYREQLHVPWMLWGPGVVPAGAHDGVVSLVDVAPTLRELFGLPGAAAQGRSVAWSMRGDGGGADVPVLAECRQARDAADRERRPQAAVLTDAWHLLVRPDGGERELYAQRGDPLQARDVAAEQDATARELSAWARHLLEACGEVAERLPAHEAEIDPAILEQLRALGYLR